MSLAARELLTPRQKVWEGAKRILKYLKATKELMVFYGRRGKVELQVYDDSGFASTADRRSVSGIIWV